MTDEAGSQPDPFSLLAVVTMIGVGLTAFCAFLVLAAYAPETARDRGGGGSALSDSAIGFAGVVDLLKGIGTPVAIRRTDPAAAQATLLVLTPRVVPATVALRLLDRAATPTLIVLPKWSVEPDRGHPGWVKRAGIASPAAVATPLPVRVPVTRADGPQHVILHGRTGPLARVQGQALGPIRDLQLIDTSSDWSPTLQTDTGGTVLAQYLQAHGKPVYVLSDPDLLNTQGLKSPDGARAAVNIIEGLRGGAPVTFDVTLNGFAGTPNLLRLLFEPPLLGATVCAGAAALLILAMAARRFGPAVMPPRVLDFGKRALADNAAGLIALAGREPRMALPYAELIRAQVLRDIGAPPRAGRAEADRLIEAAGRTRGLNGAFRDLFRESYGTQTRAEALVAAARLYAWGKDLRRGHR